MHHEPCRIPLISPRDRARITPHMFAVTNYMGHGSVRSTYWYFESTPQLLGDIATACESFVNGELSCHP